MKLRYRCHGALSKRPRDGCFTARLAETPRSPALILAARYACATSSLDVATDSLGYGIALPSPESMDETKQKNILELKGF